MERALKILKVINRKRKNELLIKLFDDGSGTVGTLGIKSSDIEFLFIGIAQLEDKLTDLLGKE